MGSPWKHGETFWVLGGMGIGAVAWMAAVALGYPHALQQPNPLMALIVLGGIVGWLAAKIKFWVT